MTHRIEFTADGNRLRVTLSARDAVHAVRLAVVEHAPLSGVATVSPLDGRPSRLVGFSTRDTRRGPAVSAYLVDARVGAQECER